MEIVIPVSRSLHEIHAKKMDFVKKGGSFTVSESAVPDRYQRPSVGSKHSFFGLDIDNYALSLDATASLTRA